MFGLGPWIKKTIYIWVAYNKVRGVWKHLAVFHKVTQQLVFYDVVSIIWISDTDDTPDSLSVYSYIYYVCIQNCTYILSKQSAPKSNGYSQTNKICLPITFYLKLVFRIINILLQFKHTKLVPNSIYTMVKGVVPV